MSKMKGRLAGFFLYLPPLINFESMIISIKQNSDWFKCCRNVLGMYRGTHFFSVKQIISVYTFTLESKPVIP